MTNCVEILDYRDYNLTANKNELNTLAQLKIVKTPCRVARSVNSISPVKINKFSNCHFILFFL